MLDYQLIYDISQEPYSIVDSGSMVFFLIFLILMVGAVGISFDRYKKEEYQGMLSSIAFFLFMFYLSRFPISDMIRDSNRHQTLVEIAQSPETKEVEGEIKNFQKMSIDRKKSEQFEVKGVEFTYNPALLTGAFNHSNRAIKEGALVRIRYHYDKNWDQNMILRLEIAESKL